MGGSTKFAEPACGALTKSNALCTEVENRD